MRPLNISAYIIPGTDAHLVRPPTHLHNSFIRCTSICTLKCVMYSSPLYRQSEYIAPRDARMTFMTGFKGSAGTVLFFFGPPLPGDSTPHNCYSSTFIPHPNSAAPRSPPFTCCCGSPMSLNRLPCSKLNYWSHAWKRRLFITVTNSIRKVLCLILSTASLKRPLGTDRAVNI